MYKYVLVVDDDICLAYAIQSYLASKEKKIFIVDNAIDAIKLLRIYSFDLIISDVMMTNYDGYDLLYYLRLNQNFASIPFVFLTAKGMTLDRVKGYDLGCNAYLIKPFHPSELLSVVNNLLCFFATHQSFSVKKKAGRENKIHNLNFTVRELSVLRFLIKGMTNKEIASSLNLSLRNVEKYVSRLLSKTKAKNRTALAQLFLFDFPEGE